ARGSHDGWFWSYYAPRKKDGTITQKVDGHEYPFEYPNSGFGLYCIRCHASAERAYTFASLRNIEGFPGQPLTFLVDDSWKAPPAPAAREARPPRIVRTASASTATHGLPPSAPEVKVQPDRAGTEADPKFLAYFDAIPDVPRRRVVAIPNQ